MMWTILAGAGGVFGIITLFAAAAIADQRGNPTDKLRDLLRGPDPLLAHIWPSILPTTIASVEYEMLHARELFPSNAHLLAALMEEVGELANALLEGKVREEIYDEAKQVACVALRIMEEGDSDFPSDLIK